MKANELRIGNYILLKGFTKPTQVWIIDTTETSTKTTASPIPLTEDWLLKFGFNLDKDKWYSIKYFTDCNESTEQMCVSINLVSNRCAVFDAIEETDMVNILSYPIFTANRIYYVHQLQNLYFALTGEELTYESKK